MPQLDPSSYSSQIFWLIITFGLLYLAIARVLLPEIGRVLRQRQDRIQSDIEQAEKLKDEAMKLKGDYESSLNQTRENARKVIDDALEYAADRAVERHRELDETLETKLSEANEKIAAAEKEAIATFTPIAAELSQQIVSKITDLDIKTDVARDVVNKLLKRA